MDQSKGGECRGRRLHIGQLPAGPKNGLTDVKGVKVGHVTLHHPLTEDGDEYACTGVTAILPHGGNLFREKVVAASEVINGFGKTTGLVQINELGLLESPVMLTNTFSVPAVSQGTLRHMLETTPEIGETTGTVNVAVGECNDGYLNSIREMVVKSEHAQQAILKATEDPVQQGAVGAGTGMVCFGYKGGIGTSSRQVTADQQRGVVYTVSALVVSNFGQKNELLWPAEQPAFGVDAARGARLSTDSAQGEKKEEDGHKAKEHIGEAKEEGEKADEDKADEKVTDGSIMIVLATDAPVSDRQLKRMAKRVEVGLGRTGSHIGHGSGDIVIAFSTAQKIPHQTENITQYKQELREDKPIMHGLFQGVAEVTQEAIYNSLLHAETTVGRKGRKVRAFSTSS